MGKAEIQRASMLIKSPKDSISLMLLTQKQDQFIGFGVFLFPKTQCRKNPTTSTKYMPADVNCISSCNKHKSDHSVWPMYFVDKNTRGHVPRRDTGQNHTGSFYQTEKISSFVLFFTVTGCCQCHSHLSVFPSNQLLHILTQSLVQVGLFMIFYGSLLQN